MITLLTTPHCAARLDDRLDVALDRPQVAGLQRADVDHHVDLGRAVEDRPPRLVVLDVGGRRAQRKPDDGTDADAGAAQQRAPQSRPTPDSRTPSRSGTPPPRGRASRCPARVASGLSSVWSIIAGDAARRAAGRVQAEPRRAGIEHAAQPVRAAVVAARRGRRTATARRGAALRRQHLFGDDVDEPLKIAVDSAC